MAEGCKSLDLDWLGRAGFNNSIIAWDTSVLLEEQAEATQKQWLKFVQAYSALIVHTGTSLVHSQVVVGGSLTPSHFPFLAKFSPMSV